MKSFKFKIFGGLLIVFSLMDSTVMACHQGGAMGMASQDPLASTIDYSSGSTFIFASTSGTLGCENWDFAKNNRVEYLDRVRDTLSIEVSQGKGEHLSALSEIYGCQGENKQTFASVLSGNYFHLFLEMKEIERYEKAHLLDYEINRLMVGSRLINKCTYISLL